MVFLQKVLVYSSHSWVARRIKESVFVLRPGFCFHLFEVFHECYEGHLAIRRDTALSLQHENHNSHCEQPVDKKAVT